MKLLRISVAAAALTVTSSAVSITIPSLVQCQPATFIISAQGNYTLEARDASHMNLILRAFLPARETSYIWPAVQVASAGILIVIVTDSFGTGRTDVAQTIAYGTVGTNPANDDRCLKHNKATQKKHGGGVEIPIVASVLGGILILLIALIFLVMLRRKRERRNHGPTEDQAQLFSGPAGGGYMSKLVPGLQLQVAPEPAPPRRQRRRGKKTWRAEEDLELPSYGDSQKIPPGYVFEAFELPERYAAMRSTTRLSEQDQEDSIRPVPDSLNRN